MTILSESDEWETPKELFNYLCDRYTFYPTFDVCANQKNKKQPYYFNKLDNALNKIWWSSNWCNPPHSQTQNFVLKACWEFLLHGNQTMMIIPSGSICTKYSESHLIGIAEYYPIIGKINFLHHGKDKGRSRNSYFVVIWRKQFWKKEKYLKIILQMMTVI